MRCCQSGLRPPGRRFGSSSARAAASRNFAAKSAVAAELADDERLDFIRRRDHQRRIGRFFRFRESHDEPVVRPHRFDVESRFGARALDGRHGPRGMNAAAKRRQDADAPVAQLVAAALDQDRPIVGHDAGGAA